MRWFWIDNFVEFVSGERAVAVKNISLSEPQIDNYLPSYPVNPCSLIIEGLAQTGGLLVGEHGGFEERVVLAKVGKAKFLMPARPGDTLRYTAIIEDIRSDGAICRGTSHIGDQLQAEAEIVFAHLDDRFSDVDLFEPAGFLRMLRMLGLYDVGRTPDGEPLKIPPHLLEAEEADLGR
jgi:3-hydroxyacyl-[acyl-carrier-protein] dehydratase